MKQQAIQNVQRPLFDISTDAMLMYGIMSLPKVDLHRHLTGSIDAETAVRIAAKYDVKLPTYVVSELEKRLFAQEEVNTLKEYFTPWAILNKLFVSKEATREIILEAVRKASEDNVAYVEFRTSPRGFLGDDPFTFEEFIETASVTALEAQERFGTIARFILGIPRHVFGRIPADMRNKMFARILSMIAPLQTNCFVGVDLNGDEAAVSPHEFKVFFRMAHDRGIPITIHAGEIGPASNVQYAVTELNASRIGHGIAAASYPDILSLLAESNCALEVCPTSNQLLGIISRIEDLPLKVLEKYKVPLVVCSDNPARCKTTLSEEYFKLAKAFGLSILNIYDLICNSLEHSFADEDTKAKLRYKLKERFEHSQITDEGRGPL